MNEFGFEVDTVPSSRSSRCYLISGNRKPLLMCVETVGDPRRVYTSLRTTSCMRSATSNPQPDRHIHERCPQGGVKLSARVSLRVDHFHVSTLLPTGKWKIDYLPGPLWSIWPVVSANTYIWQPDQRAGTTVNKKCQHRSCNAETSIYSEQVSTGVLPVPRKVSGKEVPNHRSSPEQTRLPKS